jgi:heptosyltransferase-2
MYRNILLIKPGAIGDLLHITPVVRVLKSRYPDARVTILVGSRITASLFIDNPLVEEVFVFDKKEEDGTWRGVFALWKLLRAKRYDLVLNYQRSNLKMWALVTAALPCKVLVYHKTRREVIHAIVDHLKPLAALGVDPYATDRHLDFFPSIQAEAYAERFISRNGLAGKPLVAFNPGTSHPSKCWPIERFAALADRLIDEFGCEIVVVGSKDEQSLADAIRQGMRHQVYDLCGCSLGELGALLKRTEFLVTGDTGPMHIASAVMTRVLALYGPISPERSGPVGAGHRIVMHGELDCCPCHRFDCKNPSFRLCMEMITLDEVMAAAAEIFNDKTNRG